MADQKLGLFGALSIAVGGMIGGGVFAVLGVVAQTAGSAAWAAFVGACLVSLCAAYSSLKLNAHGDNQGGSVAQFQEYLGNQTLAGMVGWTLLFGYVGAIAMYAYAFGSFTLAIVDVPKQGVIPWHRAIAIAAIAGFVGLNVLGARATGTSEKVLVVAKVAVLTVFGGLGVWYALTNPGSGVAGTDLELGLSQIRQVSPVVMATAISFVSFQGWQLLIYDQDSIRNPLETLPKAIYLSILITILIDGVIAVVVTSLAEPTVITTHPERALAYAVEPLVGHVGFLVVAVAAVFSTGSAINGTLFSSAHFAKGMLSDDLLPDRVGRAGADGAPDRTLLVLGALASLFVAYGSLDGITSFGSLAFMAVFGAMSYLAFRNRDAVDASAVPPALGALGCVTFAPLLLYHLWSDERHVFYVVLAVSVVVAVLELLYFERDELADGVEKLEDDLH
ncbi:APC family permease [Salarchaeum japonicum]|uniref:APC family permease n=1 Tax=Salarchaeum japonicum TaxID=555573 RepID=UPI003C75CB3A